MCTHQYLTRNKTVPGNAIFLLTQKLPLMSQDVTFKLVKSAKDLGISFRCYPENDYSHIGKSGTIPMSKIKIDTSKKNEVTIRIDKDRDKSKQTAQWYRDFVQGKTVHMVHTKGGSNDPGELNMALRGLLNIGGVEYPVCFGQGNYGAYHNWHLCSEQMWARPNNKKTYLDNSFYITCDGSHEFEIELSDDIQNGIGINIWAYSGSPNLLPNYDYEGDAQHPFAYKKSTLGNVGTMGDGKVFDTTGIAPLHREFHLQVLNPSTRKRFTEELYKINRITGTIGGKDVSKQTVVRFTDAAGTACLMNFGVSHAATPLGDQAYIYTGVENRRWMQQLQTDCPGVLIKDLVMAGSHDAGMYVLNLDMKNADMYYRLINLALAAIGLTVILAPLAIEIRAIIDKNGLDVALGNFSLTQKDTAYNQLLTGTRYFDFRPAYDKTKANDWMEQTYHIHSFVPGVQFSEFLKGINQFLEENPNEIAMIRLATSGIMEDYFQPIDGKQRDAFLAKYISSRVGYLVLKTTDEVRNFSAQSLKDVVGKGQRLIVMDGSIHKNDSYNDDDYSDSLTNTKAVMGALKEALADPATYDAYTVLQLQDTGSAALKHYVSDILLHSMSWANDLLGSKTGNILQATKPIFDHATYQWLTVKDTATGISKQPGFVVLLNDFVDISLTEHAVALAREKYAARKK